MNRRARKKYWRSKDVLAENLTKGRWIAASPGTQYSLFLLCCGLCGLWSGYHQVCEPWYVWPYDTSVRLPLCQQDCGWAMLLEMFSPTSLYLYVYNLPFFCSVALELCWSSTCEPLCYLYCIHITKNVGSHWQTSLSSTMAPLVPSISPLPAKHEFASSWQLLSACKLSISHYCT